MEIKPYGRRYDPIAKMLYERGFLVKYPDQILRDDLKYDSGIDIVYRFRKMTPKAFEEYSDALLLLTCNEATRYKDEKWKFARINVELNRTAKGRKTIQPTREYTAGKHEDPDIMVYGEEALGYELPEEAKSKPFLTNRVKDIVDIVETISPEGTVRRQNPYKVLTLTICIRSGMRK